MSLENSISDLHRAFDAVADQIKETYPQMWDKATSIYSADGAVDTDACVNFLIKENYAGWDGKSLVQVAEEYGEDAVIDYITAVDMGAYV